MNAAFQPFEQRPRPRQRCAGRGFTLIEVLVAVAILGLGLTAILAAQAGTFTSVTHAKNISQATGLLRCKMSEIEADTQTNGFFTDDVNDAGACCDGQTSTKMTCSWKIEVPIFPDAKIGDVNLDTNLNLGADSSGTGSPAGGLSALKDGTQGNLELPQNGNIGDMSQALAQSGNITDTATSLLMGFVYPDIQQIFQSGTRKVTGTITWSEGNRIYSIEVVETLTNARAAGVTSEIDGQSDQDDSGTSAITPGGATKSSGSGSGDGSMFSKPAPRTQP